MKYVVIAFIVLLIIQTVVALEVPEKVDPTQYKNTTCNYFLKDNSTDMISDIYFYLQIQKDDMQQRAERLNEEFYSKYSDGICDVEAFLADLNNTADLELSQLDINKLDDKTKFNDVRDVIIEPDKPVFIYSTFDRFLSLVVPKNEFMGGQSAPYLIGNTEVVLVFVNTPDMTWTNEIDVAISKMAEATNWLKIVSPPSASVNFGISYYVSTISSDPNQCDLNDAFCACYSWMEDTAKNLGVVDNNHDGRYTDDLVNFVKSNTNANNVVLAYIIKESLPFSTTAGYACPYPFFGNAERVAIYHRMCFVACKINEMDVYAHEILHLFGACDEYKGCGKFQGCTDPCIFSYTPIYEKYPNANCYDCNPNGQPCIMRGENGLGASYPELAIEYYTKGQIGWGDYDNDSVIDPKDSCPLIFGNNFDGCFATTTTLNNTCAADVYQCPDGSFVSRNPNNNCMFDPCSSTNSNLITICKKSTTNCVKSCKKCPSNYEYCQYEWTSKCGNSNGTLNPGQPLPWLTCNKVSSCILKGKPFNSTIVTTTTTTIQTGCKEICNKQTTNCQLSCKKCPSNYEYCQYEWASSCSSTSGTVNSSQSLPRLTCNKKSSCVVRGCN